MHFLAPIFTRSPSTPRIGQLPCSVLVLGLVIVSPDPNLPVHYQLRLTLEAVDDRGSCISDLAFEKI
jgi:hypothetical protein